MSDNNSTVTDAPQTPDYQSLLKQLKAIKENNGKPTPSMMANLYVPDSTGGESCCGNMNLGIFFDGTDNNKDRDYGPADDKPHPFLQRYHTNVVRLYHAYPDEGDEFRIKARKEGSADRFYRYYVPGVGTVFKDVGDIEEDFFWELRATAGSAAGFGCEPRILWGVIQVINAINRFYTDEPLVDGSEVQSAIGEMCSVYKKGYEDSLSYDFSMHALRKGFRLGAFFGLPISATGWATHTASVTNYVAFYRGQRRDAERRKILKAWIDKLRPVVAPKPRGRQLKKIALHVFGFSRGAAEARAFVRWLRELSDDFDPAVEPDSTKNGVTKGIIKLFGTIELHVKFLGIFDTVTSVGTAGLYAFSTGRAAWAHINLQIPKYVKKCVHMVAAHEARACFPLDSVRVEGKYRNNAKEEIIYPGAHSDLGGGYPLRALGKDDLGDSDKEEDLQIARVPAFDMYCRARAEGVPFYSIDRLEEINKVAARSLLPDARTIQAMEVFQNLCKCSGGVEDHLRQHTAYYLGWRWSQGTAYLDQSAFGDGEYRSLSEQADAKDEEAKAILPKIDRNRAEIEEKEKIAKEKKTTDGSIAELELIGMQLEATRQKLIAEKHELQTAMAYRRQANREACAPSTEISRLIREPLDPLVTAAKREASYLEATQRALIQVVACYCREIEARIKLNSDFSTSNEFQTNHDPLGNPLAFFGGRDEVRDMAELLAYRASRTISLVPSPEDQKRKDAKLRGEVAISVIVSSFIKKAKLPTPATVAKAIIMSKLKGIPEERAELLTRRFDENVLIAKDAPLYLKKWRLFLKKNGLVEFHKSYAPEREATWVLEALEAWEKLSDSTKKTLGNFYSAHLHDSMAGFIGKGMPEFEANGYGIAKFRRIFFGDWGDSFLCERIKAENKRRYEAMHGANQQYAPAEPYRKTTPALSELEANETKSRELLNKIDANMAERDYKLAQTKANAAAGGK